MKKLTLLLLLALAGCSKATMTSPSGEAPHPGATTVAVLSQKTGQTMSVVLAADDPQPPSCAWRDLVVAKHIALGGSTNDIVTLANRHQVFIQDVSNGYQLFDYPAPWCAVTVAAR